jgi:hypothetical protein
MEWQPDTSGRFVLKYVRDGWAITEYTRACLSAQVFTRLRMRLMLD